MLMTTFRLIVLRLYNVSFGRSAFFSKLLRFLLLKTLVYSKKTGEKYVASSRFFDLRELTKDESKSNNNC
ncbi:MAG: hypothetical protein HZB61_01600 [Nitrospirae bacterium]|nr:hypothetical protein [Nitrospirota bacterium]